ncbi:MAG TPA: 8-oxo-dGTP diphosphatase MutT [Verrucomicrobiae bacterium]|jgi:mutator protein MutT
MQLIEVSASLIFRDGKLLITQRPDEGHLANLWEFPGGKREPDETFEECLARELREELGVEVAVGELVEELTHHYPERSVHLKFFRCALKEHEPRPIGCQAVVWVSAGELKDYAFPAADKRLLEKLRANAQWWQ